MERALRSLWRHAPEVAFAAFVAVWLLVPSYSGGQAALDLRGLPDTLRAAGPGVTRGAVLAAAARALLLCLTAIGGIKLAAPFLAGRFPGLFDPRRIFPLALGVLWSLSALALPLLHLYRFASSPWYFVRLHPFTYVAFGVSLLGNAWYLSSLIRAVDRRDPAYREYRGQDGRGGIPRGSIRTRLVLLFVGITLVIVTVLSVALLRDFRSTILATVRDNGRNLAERTASVVKANLGDAVAISDYFEIERQKNLLANVRFNSLSYYQKQGKSDRFLARTSTDGELLDTELPAAYQLEAPGGGAEHSARGTLHFVAPVSLGRGDEAKVAGYAVVVYDRNVIYEPYFRTEVKVVLFSALLLYVAVFLVYAVGGKIVLPILALSTSVSRISSALSNMIAGRVRVSPALLAYKDMVRTRDEIKSLSTEFSRMSSVLRGVVPYISASTLKHADREALVSQSRDLAFLFTDIRGFTRLCEGLSPEEVVRVANHLLELQTSIILEHEGDIDKFVGDAIMAMFEGPQKELKACRAAVDICRAMAAEAERRRAAGQKVVAIGIGIHSGPVVFGSVGARDRMDFTSIGNTVNLAARLEAATREYSTKSLVSQVVRDRVADHYLCREIDLLTLKGKTDPVRAFEILQAASSASRTVKELKRYFETGLQRYREHKWGQAEEAFGYLAGTYRDEASRVFLRRIAFLRQNPPPADWDGVFAQDLK